MRFLIDEMWSRVVAEQLRDRGHDARSVDGEPALRSLSDGQLLELATNEDRVLVTENTRDFRRIADSWRRQGRYHAGLVHAPVGRFPRARNRSIGRLIAALDALAAQELGNRNLEMFLE